MRLLRKNKRKAEISDASREDISKVRKMSYVATFINPVDHRLYDIVHTGARSISVIQPIPRAEYEGRTFKEGEYFYYEFGTGHFDRDDEISYEGEEYYRSHTPGGVAVKGTGLGLMLYSGLAIAVTDQYGAGIFSVSGDRSAQAEAWWESQSQRGFVSEETITSSEQETVEADIDEDMVKCQVGPMDCEVEIESVDPDRVYVDVSYYTEKQVQILPAATVVDAGFTLAWNEESYDLFENDLPPIEVISEIDLSTTADPALIYNILVLLRDEDASKSQIQKVMSTMPSFLRDKTFKAVLEALGQQSFDFEDLQDDIDELVKKNPPKRNSRVWKDYFGTLAEPI